MILRTMNDRCSQAGEGLSGGRRLSCLLFFALLFIATAMMSAQPSWVWRNPLPQGNSLSDLFVVTPERFILVGSSGAILQTTDHGTSWNIQQYTQVHPQNLNGLTFAPAGAGWCVGDSGTILQSLDRGKTWEWRQSNITSTNLTKVFFPSNDTGWVIGEKGNIFRTNDAGRSWIKQPTGTSFDLYNASFVSTRIIWVVGAQGTVLRTTNGGAYWAIVNTGTNTPLNAACFRDAYSGIIGGSFGYLYRTSDGGASWYKAKLPAPENIYSLRALTPARLVGAGDGSFLQSFDSGKTWSSTQISSEPGSYNIFFSNTSNGVLIGENGSILRTVNTGAVWQRLDSGIHDDLRGITAIDSLHLISVGAAGAILRTTDCGLTWNPVASPTSSGLYAVCFPDSTTGFAVGEQGTIIKSTDGGASWNQIILNNFDDLLPSLAFADPQHGIILGGVGTYLSTTDGGNIWSENFIDSSTTLSSVFFLPDGNGWMLGSVTKPLITNIIFHSSDKGLSWARIDSLPVPMLLSIYFVNKNVGWAVGRLRTIFQTTDGGYSWTYQYGPVKSQFNSVFFSDTLNGWICGPNGISLHTINGGAKWVQQQTGTGNQLNDIYFYNRTKGFLIGSNGSILQTFDGGGQIAPAPVVSLPTLEVELLPNYPNPFPTTGSRSTLLPFVLTKPGDVSIYIYNILGQKIHEYHLGYLLPGTYDQPSGSKRGERWDGTDTDGKLVPTGVYFFELQMGDRRVSRKMVYLR
jgi:photosystem II stability/assembly factor-like uncharacterized protein